MELKELVRLGRRISRPYRVTQGKRFRLSQVDPQDTAWLTDEDKPRTKEVLARGVEALSELQQRLYAQNRWAVLLIFQAMDAAGKDSTIKHVMSGVNPQGCRVSSFKVPSAEELGHDYFWRCHRKLPRRGQIGIFNRSYYEEVLGVRVHPEWLARQTLPPERVGSKLWKERFADIRSFERYLANNGVLILKFFLHISREEQRQRFLSRIETPHKRWKFSAADVEERAYWKDYQAAYQEMVQESAVRWAPWYVVPANHKWFARGVVAGAIIDALANLDPQYPVGTAKRQELARARRKLTNEA